MQGNVTIESWNDLHHTFVSSINTSIIFQTFHSLKLYVHWCCLLTRYGTLTWIWNGDKDVFKENKKYPKLNFFYWKHGHRMTLIWTVSCYHVCCCNLCFVINILHTQKVEVFSNAQEQYDIHCSPNRVWLFNGCVCCVCSLYQWQSCSSAVSVCSDDDTKF